MPLYGVPWFIGGGAEHAPEVARNMLAIATQRTQGITGTPDFVVTPTPTPSSKVRVGWGSALLRKDQDQSSQQTYSAFAEQVTDVPVAATGSSGGRSDLVILRIEDSFMEGSPWQIPTNVKTGPYVFIRIIPNVPAGTTTLAQAGRGNDTAIVLARIDIPANTATITASMIRDLRSMAAPRQLNLTNFNQNSTGPITLTSSSFTNWPGYNPGNVVPEWATHAQIRYWISGIYTPGPCDGGIRMELYGPNFQPIIIGPEQSFDQDVPVPEYAAGYTGSTGGGATRFALSGAAYGPVHQFRGQLAYLRTAAYVLARADRAPITIDRKTSVVFDTTFYEYPI